MDMVAADEARGLGDMPHPPHYPKMPGEPKRVQLSPDTDSKKAECWRRKLRFHMQRHTVGRIVAL